MLERTSVWTRALRRLSTAAAAALWSAFQSRRWCSARAAPASRRARTHARMHMRGAGLPSRGAWYTMQSVMRRAGSKRPFESIRWIGAARHRPRPSPGPGSGALFLSGAPGAAARRQSTGLVAEWLCSGLQIRVRRFNSDPGLHLEITTWAAFRGPFPFRNSLRCSAIAVRARRHRHCAGVGIHGAGGAGWCVQRGFGLAAHGVDAWRASPSRPRRLTSDTWPWPSRAAARRSSSCRRRRSC